MDADTLNQTMLECLTELSTAQSKVRHCLSGYERKCEEILCRIRSGSREEAEGEFEMIFQLQGVLAKALFVHDINLGIKLEAIVREFERLDDSQSRDFWYERLQRQTSWPGLHE